jgi:thiol-disulfide isomerase/thioredoxin
LIINNNFLKINGMNDLNEMQKFSDQVITLVYASWCPYCIRFLPIFQRHEQEMPHFLLVRDDQEIAADKYDVEVVPTLLFFEKGMVTKRLDGVLGVGLSESQLSDFIKKCNITYR